MTLVSLFISRAHLTLTTITLSAILVLAAGCGSSTGGSGDSSGGSGVSTEGDPPRTIESTELGDGSADGTTDTTAGTTTDDTTAGSTTGSRGSQTEANQSPQSVPVEVSTIATDLEVPWGFAFLPGGDALFTERDSGRLLRMDAETEEIQEVQTLPTRAAQGEGGSLGLAVSPDYEQDGYLYAYYTTTEDNRVVRFRLGEEPQPILTGIPRNTYHDGGRIAFGPDGMLYVATGDAGDPSNSQAPDSLGGKILRIAPDGSVPEDNPFPDSPVYSLGHRNVEGLAWDGEGRMFASEFGEDAYDEANRIQPGENYGWPACEGYCDPGTQNAERYVAPITTWQTSEASPSGAEVLVDGAIPQWEGDLFVAALRGERLWRLELDEKGNVTDREELLSGEVGRIRNVVQAPDGSLWVTTSNLDSYGSPVSERDDRIIRLEPAGAASGAGGADG